MCERAGDAFQVVQNGLRLADQALEGVSRARIADDEIGMEFAAIGHPNAGCAAVLNDDFLDVGADDDLSSVALDGRRDGFRDAGCAADRVAGAIEIVRRDDGMDAEKLRALRAGERQARNRPTAR